MTANSILKKTDIKNHKEHQGHIANIFQSVFLAGQLVIKNQKISYTHSMIMISALEVLNSFSNPYDLRLSAKSTGTEFCANFQRLVSTYSLINTTQPKHELY